MPDPTTPPAAPVAASDNPDVMAAVQAAIAEATPEPIAPPAAEPPVAADAPPAGDPPPGDPPPDTGDTPPADPPPGDTPPAATDTPPAARPSDEFGALPEDAPAKTRERFEAMKTKYDEVAAQVATLTAARDEAAGLATQWQDTIERTGASAEQFGGMLGFLADVNSGDRARQMRGLEAAMGEVRALAAHLGVEVGAMHDPLSETGNADLLARVTEEGLDRATALELARNRATERQRAAVDQASQQQAAQKAEVDAAVAAIGQFSATQRAADPTGFNAKFEHLKASGTLELIYQLPPAKWPAAIQQAFAQVRLPAPVDPRAVAPPAPQGIRQTTNPGGGAAVSAEPVDALDAMRRAMGWNAS